MKTISFYTLGCRLNQSESAVIERTFEADGYKIVDFNQPADYVVINTCTVTENGDTDTRRLVNRVNRNNPLARIALIGCQAQVQKEKLAEQKNVKWIVGNAKKMELKDIINELSDDPHVHVITPTIPRDPFTIPVAGVDRQHTRANIKIQDGCDFFCSFCEIPYARGRARSRVFEDIQLEANALIKAGHQELVITGINVGTYSFQEKNLMDVIRSLEMIPDLKRIRISSIEPTTIPQTLTSKMNEQSKLCRYLHIPIQNGNDKILKAMQRKYTSKDFSDFIWECYNTIDGICIGTDVIVGFPGESDQHFEETFNLLKELPIHYFHVFSYSQRLYAKSQHMKAQPIDPQIIRTRSKALRDLSQRKRNQFQHSLLDTTQHILFEQKKDGVWSGLTDNYVRVYVTSNHELTNKFIPVKIVNIEDSKLFAQIA